MKQEQPDSTQWAEPKSSQKVLNCIIIHFCLLECIQFSQKKIQPSTKIKHQASLSFRLPSPPLLSLRVSKACLASFYLHQCCREAMENTLLTCFVAPAWPSAPFRSNYLWRLLGKSIAIICENLRKKKTTQHQAKVGICYLILLSSGIT